MCRSPQLCSRTFSKAIETYRSESILFLDEYRLRHSTKCQPIVETLFHFPVLETPEVTREVNGTWNVPTTLG